MTRKKGPNVTREGRIASAKAGAANLAAWVARSGGVAAKIAKDNEAALKRVDALVTRTMEALGGQDKLTPRQEHILASQRLALIVIYLSEAHLRRKGLLMRRSRPDPLLSVVVSFMNCARLNLEALGLNDDAAVDNPPSDPEERREWARKYVASRVEDRSTTP